MKQCISACLIFTLVIIGHSRTLAQTKLLESVINADSLRALVSVLASDNMKGRMTGTPENKRAAQFIAAQFDKAGVLPLNEDGFFMSFSFSQSEYALPGGTDASKVVIGYNVIGGLIGKTKPEEIIIFSAHYDHVGMEGMRLSAPIPGKAREDGDNIYNGANDNASGVAAVIALARYYARLNNNERTILFIAFSGEETGVNGSKAFVRDLDANSIKAVVNIEMIGRTPTGIHGRPFVTGYAYSNLGKELNDELARIEEHKYGKQYFRNDKSMTDLFRRSDNIPFAEKGIPAHTVMAGDDSDNHYHSVQDETESLNFNMMAEIVQAIALSTTPLVNGTITPTRIKPGHIRY
jgi:Zn-dependent M28 family amino/carboxypeptidase